MRELSISEFSIVAGAAKDANQCKNDVIAGAGMGAIAGAAVGAVAGPWAGVIAGVGALMGGAGAAINSPACLAGNNYCSDGGDYS